MEISRCPAFRVKAYATYFTSEALIKSFMDGIITSPTPTCFACGAAGFAVQTHVADPDGVIPGEWAFKKCPNTNCGLYWLDPAPLQSELWKAYATYHTHTRDTAHKVEKHLLSLANRLLRTALFPLWISNGLRRETAYLKYMTLKTAPVGKLLDIGCGGGRFMQRMRRTGWEVEGIDFDAKATARITRRYGMKTYTGDLAACNLADATYDAITMSHTIEHLPDPEKTLGECMRILKPGGKLVIVTPNVEGSAAALFGRFWRGWEPPRHLYLFSAQTLASFLHRAGFSISECRTSAAGAAVIYRVSRTNQKKISGSVSFMYRLWLIIWSYRQELAEFKAQKAGHHAAQNLLACAVKPSQH